MQFEWNEALYARIDNKVDQAMPDFKGRKVYCITDAKYKKLIRKITEIYFTHPDGPYPGTKAELKDDLVYNQKKLKKHAHMISYYGEVIQAAIDEASAAGGGIVVVPDNGQDCYYTGAIYLRSNVELHIAENAVLKFVRNKTNEYYPLRYSRWEGVECMNFSPFLYCYEEENIAITGKGTLDGAADEFNWMPWKFAYFGQTDQQIQRERLFELGELGRDTQTERIFDGSVSTLRPPFIQPYKSKNILIEDINIINSPFWEINPVLCENIKVRHISINTALYNNDGVDPESCRNMIIENCSFLTGDDCIAIKSGRNNEGRRIAVPTENIIIRNNHFSNGHGGITIGSEISGGVHDIFAHDNYFDSKELDYPIRFKTNAKRGGCLENVYIKNSVVNKSKVAVVYADFFYEEGENGTFMPSLKNITLSNIKTTTGGSIDAKNALYLKGFAKAPIENVTIEDAILNGVEQKSVLRNVKGLRLKNVSINGEKLKDALMNIDNRSMVEFLSL